MDVTEVILSDHQEQRRRFAMLDEIDSSDVESLEALWNHLAAMLEAHAEGEEVFFYPELLKLGERLHAGTEQDETVDAIGDHNDIRDGITQAAAHPVGSDGWWAGVMAARKANDDHMQEEEHEGLRDFRMHVSCEDRHRIGVAFAAFEAKYVTGVPIVDKDPQEYVREHE